MDNLRETLEKYTKLSALALKDLLGCMQMEAVPSECVIENGQLVQSRAYYMAYSRIDALALIDEGKIPCHHLVAIYQILSGKIKELKALGMTNDEISSKLKINKKTVTKGFRM